MTRRFTQGIQHILGVYRDIPAPDVNTNARVMAWMMDAFSATHGYSPAIVTGKPLDLGGAPGREAATGRGCVYVLDAYCKHHGLDLKAQRVAIQGFGNVGSWVARELHDRGAKIIAVSDVRRRRRRSRTGSTSPAWWRSSARGSPSSEAARAMSSPTRTSSRSTATSSCPPRSARSSPRPTPTR